MSEDKPPKERYWSRLLRKSPIAWFDTAVVLVFLLLMVVLVILVFV